MPLMSLQFIIQSQEIIRCSHVIVKTTCKFLYLLYLFNSLHIYFEAEYPNLWAIGKLSFYH